LTTAEFRVDPVSRIRPVIDGKVTSYFEWMGAGVYRQDGRSGSMHGNRSLVREAHYGTDGARLYLRIDFADASEQTLEGVELRLSVQTAQGTAKGPLGVFGGGQEAGFKTIGTFVGAECAFRKILEAGIPLAALGSAPIRFQFSLWKDGLPLDAVPQQGWLDVPAAEQEWPA
jgi:hypothetical protein